MAFSIEEAPCGSTGFFTQTNAERFEKAAQKDVHHLPRNTMILTIKKGDPLSALSGGI
jgi:hypothetical protein